MRFTLAPELLERFPDVCVGVVVAQGVKNYGRDDRLVERLRDAAESARSQTGARSPDEVPALATWRQRFRQLGIDPDQFPPSIGRLAQRAKEGAISSISKAVDIANIASLGQLVPAGAHDVDRLDGELQVRLSRTGDVFTPMGSGVTEDVPPGEIVYADDGEVRTRRWVWRQGDHAKVSADTRTVFFPVDGFVGQTDDAVRTAVAEIDRLAREVLGAQTTIAFVDAHHPSFEIPIASREPDPIDRVLGRGIVEILPSRAELEREIRRAAAAERPPLRIYLGVDATSPVIHIGHAVVIRKLRQLQELGCKIVLLIGDFTGRIGDPTDKSAARVPLTREQVLANAGTYRRQVAKILDFDSPTNPVELRYNGEWWDEIGAKNMIELAGFFTVQQLLQRDMFQKRLAENRPISLREFLYPLLQGYDSVELKVDAEIGGTDQTFNMLAGRTLVAALEQREKFVITCPLLEGTDGRKMSKSFGNVIGVDDPPHEMYGKVMSMSDELIPRYFELCTDLPEDEIAQVAEQIAAGQVNPMLQKKRLARTIVARYHGEPAAAEAEARFEREVQRHELPEDMPTVALNRAGDWPIVDLLVAANLAASRSEAKRLVNQGSVQVNQVRVDDARDVVQVEEGTVVRARRRSFARLAIRSNGDQARLSEDTRPS